MLNKALSTNRKSQTIQPTESQVQPVLNPVCPPKIWIRYVELSMNIAYQGTAPQPCLDPPESEWHDGQRRINAAGKCIKENTALRTKFRGGVRVQACHAAV